MCRALLVEGEVEQRLLFCARRAFHARVEDDVSVLMCRRSSTLRVACVCVCVPCEMPRTACVEPILNYPGGNIPVGVSS